MAELRPMYLLHAACLGLPTKAYVFSVEFYDLLDYR